MTEDRLRRHPHRRGDDGGTDPQDPLGLTPGHAAILRDQHDAGNRAVAALLRSSTPVASVADPVAQRQSAFVQRDVRTSYQARALRNLRTAQDGPTTYLRMRRLVAPDPQALAGLADADALIRAEVDQLRARHTIAYGNPALDAAEGRTRLGLIERRDPQALAGLVSADNALQERPEDAVEHEWGLGIARTGTGEAIFVIGDATGVTWDAAVRACLTPVAHSHPYFEAGPARNRRGGVSTATKEIADHQFGDQRVTGAVLWSDLAGRVETAEMQKIFPSASDVAFAADNGIKRHEVFTPYLVLDHPAGRAITNPFFTAGLRFRDAPRLSFEIQDASRISPGGSDYRCHLVVRGGAAVFAQMDIRTQGAGQFGALVW
ncbi:hypothetical protein [Occultella gossypii]|uniref:Phage major capsid protein n=1 Tax=Occultella gossypii TaxID=2800820 RepID=A0ABS7SA77_9MICO|nr:hypothetical protein [Occultella gossypii]MBZ2196148.1 hypothetical protein [Occultella gossypii]